MSPFAAAVLDMSRHFIPVLYFIFSVVNVLLVGNDTQELHILESHSLISVSAKRAIIKKEYREAIRTFADSNSS